MTLLDVLIAIAILALGTSALLAAALTALAGNAQARLLTDATALARDAMERLVLQTTPQAGGDQVDRRGCATGRGCTPVPPLFARTWTVTPVGTVNRLQVTVRYNDSAGQPHQVVLDGLR